MAVTLDLPDHIANALVCDSDKDLSRQAFEALALDGYREDFLAAHLDLYDYDPAELSWEAEQLREYTSRRL